MSNPTEAPRAAVDAGMLIAVQEQMWLALARELAATGALDAEQLARRLEEHAQRAPDLPAWVYGLTHAAQALRRGASSDPDNLVQ